MLSVARNYKETRALIKNNHNGYAYIGCVITDKQYIL